MDDPDIAQTIMTVKEMICFKYELNQLKENVANNSGILTGDRPYLQDSRLPKFHVPVFQPKVLSQVPKVDRAKLLFPINVADFLFKDGVRVWSAAEMQGYKEEQKVGPNLKQFPYISHYGTELLSDTPVLSERVFTN